jgi:hypothetical protein
LAHLRSGFNIDLSRAEHLHGLNHFIDTGVVPHPRLIPKLTHVFLHKAFDIRFQGFGIGRGAAGKFGLGVELEGNVFCGLFGFGRPGRRQVAVGAGIMRRRLK